jgi:hypothetical protein
MTATVQVRASAYYPFNGNANDESTSGNNGTVSGATLTTDRFGVADKAYSFNGTSNYIYNSTMGDFSGNTVTLSLWIYVDTIPANYRSIITTDNWWGPVGMILEPNGEITFSLSDAAGTNKVRTRSTISITTGVWHHLVLAGNLTNLRGYIDGVEVVNSSTSTITSIGPTRQLMIGAQNSTPVAFFVGKIDEVIILPVALTPTEVAALYELTSRHDWNDVFVDGKFGKGIEFCSANNYGPYLPLGSLASNPGAETLSLWIYPKKSGVIIAEQQNAIPNNAYHYIKLGLNSNNTLMGNIWSVNKTLTFGAVEMNAWNHVAMTWSGTTLKSYLNGILVDTETGSRSPPKTQFLILGAYNTQTAGGFNVTTGFNGIIDELVLFGKELSSTEVNILYNASGKVLV